MLNACRRKAILFEGVRSLKLIINISQTIYICFLILLVPAILSAQNIVINEIQASNGKTIFDEDDDAEDWIELFNDSDSSISLAGYGLSDDYDDPFQWTFPDDVLIRSGEYLLIWGSGKDRININSPLHTNFRISSNGEEILLTAPDSTRIDEIEPISIPRDISYGRYPDGSGEFFFFDEPTPGASNTGKKSADISNPPGFSHSGGVYSQTFQLTLSSSGSDTEIYYTTNGDAPEPETSKRYSTPITINGSVMVRAISVKEDALPSHPRTEIFNRISSSLSDFSSDLPLVIINQYDTEITDGDRTPAAISFFDLNESGRSQLSGKSALQSRMVINKRGSSSLDFPKNMFGFHLRDEDDTNRSEGLLGLPPDHNWILYAPYTDMTLMRNAVSYQLSEDMGYYAPRTQFVELYLHSGKGVVSQNHYHGVYMLVERIKWSEHRVNIEQITPGDNSEPEISGGYIIAKDRLGPVESGFRTRKGTLLANIRPNEEDITQQQKNWIRNYMSDFEEALFGSSFDDPDIGYEAFINTDSFIDHFLITELLKEIDGYRLSTFMFKDRGEKLTMGPVWDFNLSLGIADYLEGWKPDGWYYSIIGQNNECFIGCGVVDWYERLLEDPAFRKRVNNRWWELRNNVFSKTHLLGLIGKNRDMLMESQQRNFDRWPTIGTYVWPNWYIGNSFDDEVNWMKNWLQQRLSWMDNQIGEPSRPENPVLTQFWHFSDELPNDTPLTEIDATFSSSTQGLIEYQSALTGYPFDESHPNWRKASMERRNRPTPLNYRPEANNDMEYIESEMRGLQIRQPFTGNNGENKLVFHLPTTGFAEFIFSFAAMDEGAAETMYVDYSVSSEQLEWISEGLSETDFNLSDEYKVYSLDFSDIEQVNNNPDFKIRIRFNGENLTNDDGDRVTFNNFALEAANFHREEPEEKPLLTKLRQNYPNPFQASTILPVELSSNSIIKLEVFDLTGRRVATLADDFYTAGVHEFNFDSGPLSSGIYIYRLTTRRGTQTKKMVLIK